MHRLGFYKNKTEEEIKDAIIEEGFMPVRVTNSSGYVYNAHSHKETKLLAFLHGGMRLRVQDDFIECYKGDKVVIPSGVIHSAEVLKGGCIFFWAEKIL